MAAFTRLWCQGKLVLSSDRRSIHAARCHLVRPFYSYVPDFGRRFEEWIATRPNVIYPRPDATFCDVCLPVYVNGCAINHAAKRSEADQVLRRRYEAGETTRGIATDLGVSHQLIHQRLVRAGTEMRGARGSKFMG